MRCSGTIRKRHVPCEKPDATSIKGGDFTADSQLRHPAPFASRTNGCTQGRSRVMGPQRGDDVPNNRLIQPVRRVGSGSLVSAAGIARAVRRSRHIVSSASTSRSAVITGGPPRS